MWEKFRVWARENARVISVISVMLSALGSAVTTAAALYHFRNPRRSLARGIPNPSNKSHRHQQNSIRQRFCHLVGSIQTRNQAK
jgi:hypothetical protein